MGKLALNSRMPSFVDKQNAGPGGDPSNESSLENSDGNCRIFSSPEWSPVGVNFIERVNQEGVHTLALGIHKWTEDIPQDSKD